MTTTAQLAEALTKFRANSRVSRITVIVNADACPACQAVQGTYPKDAVPALPVEGCSCPSGNGATYIPVLNQIYP
jgi:hypothetical protein